MAIETVSFPSKNRDGGSFQSVMYIDVYLSWLVVWNILYFSIYWESSSQLTHIFQMGTQKPPSSEVFSGMVQVFTTSEVLPKGPKGKKVGLLGTEPTMRENSWIRVPWRWLTGSWFFLTGSQ